jgi:regulator of nonsense transcripts 3
MLLGNESFAVVEYAPYQKVPGEKKKPDSRHATIEKGMSLFDSACVR